ncbi:MAG: CaiB/BaiF CoA-transferase family protein [Gammaproteobacteria bacterium]|nr:CaiB/BaiF CoA-transferase family protein [Gammaproteobacteria bacterium]
MAGPLAGLRVLDLSRIMAGPWCTQIFADLGAEVIKVERPGVGDDTRQWGPPWFTDKQGNETRESSYYLSANRGKNSITVNLGDPEGLELVKELAGKCDFLVENFKTGDLNRKGLGYEALRAINPGLIYCSITGFGQTGPMSQDPGYDYLIQAQGGLMSITGVADGQPGAGPQRVGLATADLTTGMNAAIAILAALHYRHQTGEGQFIDMALLDVQVSWLANQAQNYFCSGQTPVRTGEYHPNLAPYQPFPTQDGELVIAVGNDVQFQRLCDALGVSDLAADPLYATNPARVKNRTALVEALKVVTGNSSSRELMALLRKIKVPCGPIQTIEEVFSDPQVLARNMVVEVQHPEMGAVPTVANPIKFSSTALEYLKAPPRLGEDTETVLADLLGLSAAAINGLKERGVV